MAAWKAGGLVVGLAVAGMAVHVGGAQDFIIRVSAMTFVGITLGCTHARRSTGRI